MQDSSDFKKILLVILLILLIVSCGCIEKSGNSLSVVAIVPDPTTGQPKTSYGNAIPITGTTEYTFEPITMLIWDENNVSANQSWAWTSNDMGMFNFYLVPPDFLGTKPGNYSIRIKDVAGKNVTARWQVTGSPMHRKLVEWIWR